MISILGNSKMTFLMEREFIYGLMVINMKAISKLVKWKVVPMLLLKMVIYMKVVLKIRRPP